MTTHHSHSRRSQNILCSQDCVIGDVGEHVPHNYRDHRHDDSQGDISTRKRKTHTHTKNKLLSLVMPSITADFIWQYNWLQSGEPTNSFLLYCTWESCRKPRAASSQPYRSGLTNSSRTKLVWNLHDGKRWGESLSLRVWAPVCCPCSALPPHLPAGVCEHACIESQRELIQNQRLPVKSILEVLGVPCRGDRRQTQSRKMSETGFLPSRITSLVPLAQSWEGSLWFPWSRVFKFI